jgi:hypothetical protein
MAEQGAQPRRANEQAEASEYLGDGRRELERGAQARALGEPAWLARGSQRREVAGTGSAARVGPLSNRSYVEEILGAGEPEGAGDEGSGEGELGTGWG